MQDSEFLYLVPYLLHEVCAWLVLYLTALLVAIWFYIFCKKFALGWFCTLLLCWWSVIWFYIFYKKFVLGLFCTLLLCWWSSGSISSTRSLRLVGSVPYCFAVGHLMIWFYIFYKKFALGWFCTLLLCWWSSGSISSTRSLRLVGSVPYCFAGGHLVLYLLQEVCAWLVLYLIALLVVIWFYIFYKKFALCWFCTLLLCWWPSGSISSTRSLRLVDSVPCCFAGGHLVLYLLHEVCALLVLHLAISIAWLVATSHTLS